MNYLIGFVLSVALWCASTEALAQNKGKSGLPAAGSEGDCLRVSAGVWAPGVCPGAAGGDSVSINGGAVVDPNFATTGSDVTITNTSNVITFTLKSGLTVTNWTMVNPALGTPASGVATNLTGTAAGLTAGTATVANSGDSATSFFSSGTIEDARLPTSMADKVATGSFNIPNGAAPTTDAFGEIAGDNNAWAASRGAVQWYDGTANTYLLGTLASDTPANGECPKWNTGGTITWETCASGGAMATDTLWDVAGDLAYGTGSNTASRLAPGTANQLLRMNSGATAPEWTSTVTGLTSVAFGSNPADEGRLRLSNNEKLCWELNTPGTDKCLFLNASDEFELNAPLNITGTPGPALFTGVVSPSAPAGAEQWYFYANSVDDLPKYIYNGGSEQTFYTTANKPSIASGVTGLGTGVATALGVGNNSAGGYSPIDGTAVLTNKTISYASNAIIIPVYGYTDMAGCNNATAGPVWNLPTTNAAVPTCDTGTNQFQAYLAFNADTDQSTHGQFKLQTGYSGGVNWLFRYKMASATTGTIGWCVQLVRLPTGSAADPAFPAQATGNCVSQTVPGTAGFESEATITGVTCTSCVAGDMVKWRLTRDADGSAVSDSATGDGRLVHGGYSYDITH